MRANCQKLPPLRISPFLTLNFEGMETTPTKREVLKKMINGEPADLKSMIIVCHRNEGQLMHGSRPISQQFINKFAALLIEAQTLEDASEIQEAINKLEQVDFIDNQIVNH